MSESLRNDGRIWVPVRAGDDRAPNDIPEDERDYYLERMYPSYGNLSPRDVSSRGRPRTQIEAGRGVGPLKNSVYLDFRDALARLGSDKIAERYGNLFSMYRDATGEDPYQVPMRIAPGAHFSMGGLWNNFDQMTSIPESFRRGRGRLGIPRRQPPRCELPLLSACVDGWFTLPYSVPDYLAGLLGTAPPAADDPAVTRTLDEVEPTRRASTGGGRQPGTRPVPPQARRRALHRLWSVPIGTGADRRDRRHRRADRAIPGPTCEWPGQGAQFNQELEKAGRVADFLGLARLMCIDALDRDEIVWRALPCRTPDPPDGEAERDDDRWCFVSAWEHRPDSPPVRHDEALTFAAVPLQTRNYV